MSLTLILLLQLFIIASCQHTSYESSCAAQLTCSSCLQTPSCVWCSHEGTEKKAGPTVRCVTRDKYKSERDLWCPSSKVYHKWSTASTLQDAELSSDKTNPVQVQPQRMNVRLRIGSGEEQRVILWYKQVEDYPVDLYYLMDLSKSMLDHRNALSKLGTELVKTMKNLTSNFRLGFGSFIDKVVMPMTSTIPAKLKAPCMLNSTVPCAPPYSYQHQMRLTENVDEFGAMVQKANVSGNLDSPEGGFDALMQVMVCKDEIGWRPNARHLVIFSTDASFHIAGDGRLAGIIEPNDCLCHLDKDGFYTYSLLQDYPSISQISRKASENNVNIIFAVTPDISKSYERLHKRISGTSVGQLDSNSLNVVKLVAKEYEKLKDSVEMIDNRTEFINVKYFTKCLGGELKERKSCVGRHRGGDIIEFEIVIEAIKCPEDPKDWKQILQIKPRSLNESLIIELELLCQCDCEKPGDPGYKVNVTQCKGGGDLKCGVCSCYDGFHGKQCACKGNEADATSVELMDNCKRPNDTQLCSGHGICDCGMCKCHTGDQRSFGGTYCECDNFTCKRDKGKVCGGHGECKCGTCTCNTGWQADDCSCKDTEVTCTPPGENSTVCNDRGKCTCGRCHCEVRNGIQYTGEFCEDCPTCPEICEELKDCVQCLAYKEGPLIADGLCGVCGQRHNVEIVEKIEEDTGKDGVIDGRICKTHGDAGCTFVFKYKSLRGDSGSKMYQIFAEKNRACPVTVNLMGVAIGVIVSTVVLGFLLLIIWKVLTMVHDQREFAKFEKERALAKWDRGDNPLYKQATSSFENPTFAEGDKN